MGTTLTGTTPQDTYDSLIKVTDNGPLSGTLKALSDGLGNDSTLSLSTAAASIAGTLAVTGSSTFSSTTAVASTGGTSQMRIDRSGSVARMQNYDTGQAANISLQHDGGNVGIGTSAPTEKLTVNGSLGFQQSGTQTYHINPASSVLTFVRSGIADVMSVTANGLCFGSDTAAANALDDYEEGTWTMGVSFGGASVGVTTSGNTGTYTKIGRQVTVNGLMTLTSKGSSTGDARITGLPFTIANAASNYSAPSLWIENITFANQYQAFGNIGSTNIILSEVTILGVATNLSNADFANNSQIVVTLTYFV